MIDRTQLPANVLCVGVIKGGKLAMAVNEDLVTEEETQEFKGWRKSNR